LCDRSWKCELIPDCHQREIRNCFVLSPSKATWCDKLIRDVPAGLPAFENLLRGYWSFTRENGLRPLRACTLSGIPKRVMRRLGSEDHVTALDGCCRAPAIKRARVSLGLMDDAHYPGFEKAKEPRGDKYSFAGAFALQDARRGLEKWSDGAGACEDLTPLRVRFDWDPKGKSSPLLAKSENFFAVRGGPDEIVRDLHRHEIPFPRVLVLAVNKEDAGNWHGTRV
jgi:hypothetical protein